MTCCGIWIVNQEIYAIADSAITWARSPSTEMSTFGDYVPKWKDGKVTEEAMCKIFVLGSNALAILAGSVHAGQQYISRLRENVSEGDLADHVHRVIVSDFSIFKCELVVGRVYADRAEMVVFDGHRVFEETQGGLIGNLPSFFATQLNAHMALSAWRRQSPDQRLIAAVAILRSKAVRYPLIDRGIGGAIYGAYIGSDGIRWMPDTTFVLFDPSSLRNEVTRVRTRPPADLLVVNHHFDEVRIAIRDGIGHGSTLLVSGLEIRDHARSEKSQPWPSRPDIAAIPGNADHLAARGRWSMAPS